jgi:hypothetical protein
MKSWQPGEPINTPEAKAQWQQRRKARMLEQQRKRRAKYRRIDYYPDNAALEAIEPLLHRSVGGDLSSTLNRIVSEWQRLMKRREKKAPELSDASKRDEFTG